MGIRFCSTSTYELPVQEVLTGGNVPSIDDQRRVLRELHLMQG